MGAIPLNRTTSLRGFVTFLRTLGAPVDRGLRRAKLRHTPTLYHALTTVGGGLRAKRDDA